MMAVGWVMSITERTSGLASTVSGPTGLMRHVPHVDSSTDSNGVSWKNEEEGAATSVLAAASPLVDGVGDLTRPGTRAADHPGDLATWHLRWREGSAAQRPAGEPVADELPGLNDHDDRRYGDVDDRPVVPLRPVGDREIAEPAA